MSSREAGAAALDALHAALAPVGLNALGVASVVAYDAAVPPARRSAAIGCAGAASVAVWGSGGPALWEAFLAWLDAAPARLLRHAHPLDAFVAEQVTAASAAHLQGVPHRWFFAAATEALPLDFRVLAHLAGLGTASRLGLLLHPTYGPWMGLRAACFLPYPLPPSRVIPHEEGACAACPAPCVAACPGGAFAEGRWSVQRCADFHAASPTCTLSCAARAACPQGAAHRYPREEITYHSHRDTGRAALRARLGLPVEADPFPGEGPLWGDWAERVDVKGARTRTDPVA